MKKHAFTLAEILITLGIIGVTAAIVMPLVSNFKPDITKMKYLQTYDMLTKVMNELANNPKYYPPVAANSSGNLVNYSEHPFFNINTAKDSNGNDLKVKNYGYGEAEIKGWDKLSKVFSDYTNLKCTGEACTKPEYIQAYPGYSMFKAKNGVGLFFTTNIKTTENDSVNSYQTDIYIDVNGQDKGKNKMYPVVNNPDVFKFVVTASGRVVPADAMGKYYLDNRNNWKKTEPKNEELTTPNIEDDLKDELEFDIELVENPVATTPQGGTGSNPPDDDAECIGGDSPEGDDDSTESPGGSGSSGGGGADDPVFVIIPDADSSNNVDEPVNWSEPGHNNDIDEINQEVDGGNMIQGFM